MKDYPVFILFVIFGNCLFGQSQIEQKPTFFVGAQGGIEIVSDLRADLGIEVGKKSSRFSFSAGVSLSKSILPDQPGLSPKVFLNCNYNMIAFRASVMNYRENEHKEAYLAPQFGLMTKSGGIRILYGFNIPLSSTNYLEKNHVLTLLITKS